CSPTGSWPTRRPSRLWPRASISPAAVARSAPIRRTPTTRAAAIRKRRRASNAAGDLEPGTNPVNRSGAIRGAACACFISAPLVVLLKYVWPLLISHQHEQPMRDGPGVLSHGACCVEPAYHLFGRVAFGLAVSLLIAGVLI